ncbi:MAG: homocysteine S-methyltransferase family protein [Gammaproteobacteria bacterium]|nr:homocysteine S-methyltransferase family protein [Gammaproteobacteria bacterium]
MSIHYRQCLDVLRRGGTLLLDGGTGTELERRGATMHESVWCATVTSTHPEILSAVHRDYIGTGANVITANTFSSSRNMLGPAGLGDLTQQLNRRAVEIALQARDASAPNHPVVIAGSMSHQLPIVPGKDYRDESQIPTDAVLRSNFLEMADVLAESGADLILMEMMSDPRLAVPALEAARSTGLPIWIGYACRADGGNRAVPFYPVVASIAEMVEAIAPQPDDVVGMMHTPVHVMADALEQLRAVTPAPLMAYPDSGYFEMPNWQFTDVISPVELAKHARSWRDVGVQVFGGCCGLGVEHIRCLAPEFAA